MEEGGGGEQEGAEEGDDRDGDGHEGDNDGDDQDDDDRTISKAQSGDGSWSSFSTFPECEPGGKRKSCKELFSCQVEKVMAAL